MADDLRPQPCPPISGGSDAEAEQGGKDASVTAMGADVKDKSDWRAPPGFGEAATLHALVEETAAMLPLAGGPRLAMIGREVWLGGNSLTDITDGPLARLTDAYREASESPRSPEPEDER